MQEQLKTIAQELMAMMKEIEEISEQTDISTPTVIQLLIQRELVILNNKINYICKILENQRGENRK
jgi:cell division protein ZapA (FtsZ GTPase activity inhibitor)